MIRMRFFLPLLCLALMPATMADAKRFKVPIDKSFISYTSSGSEGGVATVFLGIKNAEGQVAICGAYLILEKGPNTRAGNFRQFLPRFLQRSTWVHGDVDLRMSGGHFNEVTEDGPKNATCRTSRVKWQDGFSSQGLDRKQKQITIQY